jgi:DNA-binding transcriptional MerR regulator
MTKAADAFRTISEVAEDLGIQKHVLRFWEVKFSQIRPMKRGGGRRYYRPEDMELLRGIRRLLHSEGYTIKGVQKILREQGIEAVKERTDDPEDATGATARKGAEEVNVSASPRRRGGRAKGKPQAKMDRSAVIEQAIAELSACRELLAVGAKAAGKRAAKAPGRARRSA